MAFCTICGKELAEGQVCDCQQAAAPQENVTYAAPQGGFTYAAPQAPAQPSQVAVGNIFKDIWGHVVNTVKRPFEAAEEWFENSSIAKSSIVLGIITFLYMMTGLLNVVGKRIALKSVWKKEFISEGGFLVDRFGSYWKEIKAKVYENAGLDGAAFVKGIFFPLIYMVVLTGVCIGLAYAINAIFIKGKVEIKKVLSFASAVSVPVAAACALKMILSVVNIGLSEQFIGIIITLLGFVTLLQGLSLISKIITDKKKCFLALLMGVAVFALAGVTLSSTLGKFAHFVTLPM